MLFAVHTLWSCVSSGGDDRFLERDACQHVIDSLAAGEVTT